MSAGDFAAWAAVVAALLIAAIGGTFKLAQRRADRAAQEHGRQIAERDRKIQLLEQTADKQDEVIADLRSQRDRLQITAELQDRFFGQLPKNRNVGD